MSKKYHVNTETGNAGACTAKPGNCPFGADEDHFVTKTEAMKKFENDQSNVLEYFNNDKYKMGMEVLYENIPSPIPNPLTKAFEKLFQKHIVKELPKNIQIAFDQRYSSFSSLETDSKAIGAAKRKLNRINKTKEKLVEELKPIFNAYNKEKYNSLPQSYSMHIDYDSGVVVIDNWDSKSYNYNQGSHNGGAHAKGRREYFHIYDIIVAKKLKPFDIRSYDY